MRTLLSLSALSLAAVLAACGPTSNQPPMSTSGAGGGNLAPQSPNSLPPGSSTDQPLTSPTGTVGQTSVGGAPMARPGTGPAYAGEAAPPPRRRVVRRRRPVRPARPVARPAAPAPTTATPGVPSAMPAPATPAPSTTR